MRSYKVLDSGKKPSKAERYEACVKPSGKSFVKRVMRHHERDNRGLANMPKEAMRNGFLVLNSSYTQAANPNTMRDFGGPRNVVYNFVA